jgi:putative ATP-dependent endonuclease of OLD family
MRLVRLTSSGFRSLREIELSFEALTVLIGENDTGKSSVLDLLNILLGGGKPDDNDFYRDESGHCTEEIEADLEFSCTAQDERAWVYAIDGKLRVRRRYTQTTSESLYWGQRPVDGRLGQDFEKLKAAEQTELIRAYDEAVLLRATNAASRVQWLREYAQSAPQVGGWIPAPSRWGEFLPRFERYSTMDYSSPDNMILKSLRQVYEQVVYEEVEGDGGTARRPIESLRLLEAEVNRRVQEKVSELLDYMRRYNRRVREIRFEPVIDFAGGLRSGAFQLDDGRGLRYLAKTGDGTKRRMFIAAMDWDREVAAGQAAQGASLPDIIRGYDEPDTNLHYEAQRRMYQAIAEVTSADHSRIQAIVCTHSLTMVDRAPAQSIRLLRLGEDGCTQVEKLETDGDPEVEHFLCELAREIGITNTLIFYERCFILIEGETEENALPLLYKRIYGRSLLEDGIRIINVRGNGAIKEFLKLLRVNRQQLTIVFADRDCQNDKALRLTERMLKEVGFAEDFVNSRLVFVGAQEFEDAFADDDIAQCLQRRWPRLDRAWQPSDIAGLRASSKMSESLASQIWQYCSAEGERWSKPVFGKHLAECCDDQRIPQEIRILFEQARKIAETGFAS